MNTEDSERDTEGATNASDSFDWGPIIYSYTRAQAIEDGILVDIPPQTRMECGIKFSLVLTRTVWDSMVEIPPGLEGSQDRSGRLHDILTMFSHAARKCTDDRLLFNVLIQYRPHPHPPELVQLKAVIDGGDDGKGAITIMLPSED